MIPALVDRVRAAWDVRRDGVETWESSFEVAREALAQRLEHDAKDVRAMTWDYFKRHMFGVGGEPTLDARNSASADAQQPDFCDANCTWLDHAPGCERSDGGAA